MEIFILKASRTCCEKPGKMSMFFMVRFNVLMEGKQNSFCNSLYVLGDEWYNERALLLSLEVHLPFFINDLSNCPQKKLYDSGFKYLEDNDFNVSMSFFAHNPDFLGTFFRRFMRLRCESILLFKAVIFDRLTCVSQSDLANLFLFGEHLLSRRLTCVPLVIFALVVFFQVGWEH